MELSSLLIIQSFSGNTTKTTSNVVIVVVVAFVVTLCLAQILLTVSFHTWLTMYVDKDEVKHTNLKEEELNGENKKPFSVLFFT